MSTAERVRFNSPLSKLPSYALNLGRQRKLAAFAFAQMEASWNNCFPQLGATKIPV